MKFKMYVEAEKEAIKSSLEIIRQEIKDFDKQEIDDFSDWIQRVTADDFDPDAKEYDEYELITVEEIMDILSGMNQEDLDYVLYMMNVYDELEDDELEDDDLDDDLEYDLDDELEDIDEISIIFKAKNRNKKKTKRFTISKAKFRAGKPARNKKNRKNKIKNKKRYRINKIKIKKYNKSYRAAVVSRKHYKKIRR